MVETSEEKAWGENRYSYSKLTSFNTCKFGYRKRYIEHQRGIGNCFSSYGTLLHSILERYGKGELSIESLLDTYEWEFGTSVSEQFPNTKYCPDMRKLYYNQGLDFLSNFKGYSNIDILDVETEFDIPLYDWIFTGVIDFVFIDKKTNELILRDWKSKSSFKNKQEEAEYRRQLYLYCIYIKNRYGRYPDKLQFYLLRKNKIIEACFKEEDLLEAVNWANNTVKEIRQCWSYPPSPDAWFCNYLCNHRTSCPYKAK